MTSVAATGRLPEPANTDGLALLEAGLATDLDRLGFPRKEWTAPRNGPDGKPLLDVLVIGAGQFGIGVATALKFSGISNFLIIDRAPEGKEGPWITYARMPTLRSPKHHPGICFGVPSLTFQSWYRAAHGDAAWEAMYKIPNGIWQDYILWVRSALDIPVRNEADAVDLQIAEDHAGVVLADGETIYAKRVVVASGRAATGGYNQIPGLSPDLGRDQLAHTMHPIDFTALQGKRIAMVGVGSSAFDNAATALESGAASVDMFARRQVLPQLNKGRPSSGLGFLDGWQGLPDEDRWRLGSYLDEMNGVPPHETILRCVKLPGMNVHFRSSLVSAGPSPSGGVRLEMTSGPSGDYDFLILGTGFRVDLSAEPLFASIFPRVLLWRDAYTPPEGLQRPHLGAQPYIGSAFELQSKAGGPLDRIHLFNTATFMSAGMIASDVPGLDIAPERLVTGITRKIFAEDFDALFDNLKAWEEEHELETTPFYVPEFVNRSGR